MSVEGVNKSAISRVKGIGWNTVHCCLERAGEIIEVWNGNENSGNASRTLDSHGSNRHPPIKKITASSFKLRANAPEGQKAISDQSMW